MRNANLEAYCEVKMQYTSVKRILAVLSLSLLLAVMGTAPAQPQSSATAAVYLDPKQPIDIRVNDLMSRMTVKEKVGQLNLPCVYVDQLGKTIAEKKAACRRFAAGTYTD